MVATFTLVGSVAALLKADGVPPPYCQDPELDSAGSVEVS